MPNPFQHGALQLQLPLWQLRFPFAVVPEVSRKKAAGVFLEEGARDQVVLQEICNPLKFRSEPKSVVSRAEQLRNGATALLSLDSERLSRRPIQYKSMDVAGLWVIYVYAPNGTPWPMGHGDSEQAAWEDYRQTWVVK